jgi:hypothetical protein
MSLAEAMGIARAHEENERLAEAESMLARVLAVAPDHADALHLLGIVLYKLDRHAEALPAMRRALELGIDTPLYYRNITELYRALGELDQAEAAARRAVALSPADPVALVNQGVVLADLCRPREAIDCFRRSLALNPAQPGAHFGLAEALLKTGDLKPGWEEYEWRFSLPGGAKHMPKIDRPQWDGRAMPDATVLLYADQGFGDAIQFGRYLSWAVPRCRDVTLACSPTLRPILAQMAPSVEAGAGEAGTPDLGTPDLGTPDPGAPETGVGEAGAGEAGGARGGRLRIVDDWRQAGRFAEWLPLTGLARLAGTTLETIPPYPRPLRAEPARAARWRARLDGLTPAGLRRVGIVWAGRPTHKNDRRRSTTLATLAPLAAVDGVALVVLQKGPSQRQVAQYDGRAPLIHLSAEIDDFADTIAAIEHLDLVVTVDTSVAHLAGAMGKKVWIMLPWAAEWRWMEHRADTPWYPSARLFRQVTRDDWHGVAVAVAEAMRVDNGS